MSKEAIEHYEAALKEAFPSGASGDVFYHWNEARKALAEQPAQRQEPYGWHTEDHLTDRSATTYSKDVADRWKSKGWPVTPFYTSPPAQRKPLTDDEILVANYPDGEENGPTIAAPNFELICFARQIEAKLQEKNT